LEKSADFLKTQLEKQKYSWLFKTSADFLKSPLTIGKVRWLFENSAEPLRDEVRDAAGTVVRHRSTELFFGDFFRKGRGAIHRWQLSD
jgi:hypothetical protein